MKLIKKWQEEILTKENMLTNNVNIILNFEK